MHPLFGAKITIHNALRDLLKKAPKLCSSDVTLIMRGRYETTYGIYNHDIPEGHKDYRPLARVKMNWSEDTTNGSLLYERIRKFKDLKIGSTFNLSLSEFLSFPTHICNYLEILSAEEKRKESGMAADIEKELEKAAREMNKLQPPK